MGKVKKSGSEEPLFWIGQVDHPNHNLTINYYVEGFTNTMPKTIKK
jgi:hypothetical protein